jgi:hypothetical protein
MSGEEGLEPVGAGPPDELSSLSGEPTDVDMLLAALRADGQDNASYFEVLAGKLADVFGPRLTVDRDGGLFRKPGRAKRISVDLGGDRYEAALDKGAIRCKVSHAVRGITLRSDEPAFPDWLSMLMTKVAEEARSSEATRRALESILLG